MKASEDYIKNNRDTIKTGLILLLTVIAGVYINLFTNSDNMKDFFGINLNVLGEMWFMLAFGLIAMISLVRACISIIIIAIIGFVSSFGLYTIYRAYMKLLISFELDKKILSLFIIMFTDFFLAMVYLWGTPNPNIIDAKFLVKFLSIFILIWIGLIKAKLIAEEMEKGNGKSKVMEERREPVDGKKILFTIEIIILTLVGISLSWILSNRFALMADPKYINTIITTSVFLAGFGLLAIEKCDSSKDNFWLVFLPNNKSIILWSMGSIIFAFCYIIFQESKIWGKMFFSLSGGFLFFTITLIVLLVLFHDNPYLKELEKN